MSTHWRTFVQRPSQGSDLLTGRRFGGDTPDLPQPAPSSESAEQQFEFRLQPIQLTQEEFFTSSFRDDCAVHVNELVAIL